MLQYSTPLVSIVTVVYNGFNTLEKTIESVLGQTYPNIEYIIIDGGSTDGTLEIIKKYEDQIAFWSSEPDKGIYDAMNKGLKKATGEWIGIINSDDWYDLNAVDNLVLKVNEHPDAHIVHGNLNVFNQSMNVDLQRPLSNINLLNETMAVLHPTVFVKRMVYDEQGGFNDKFKLCADWDLMRRFFLANLNFVFIDKVMANFSLGGASNGFGKTHLRERWKIRHQESSKLYYYDFKDFLIYLYFSLIKR